MSVSRHLSATHCRLRMFPSIPPHNTQTHAHTRRYTPTRAHTHKHAHKHTHTYAQTPTNPHPPSNTRTVTYTYLQTRTHKTQTHAYKHKRTHTCTEQWRDICRQIDRQNEWKVDRETDLTEREREREIMRWRETGRQIVTETGIQDEWTAERSYRKYICLAGAVVPNPFRKCVLFLVTSR